MPYRLCLVLTIAGLACLLLAGARATAEAKTAQQCYKEDSHWTAACGALEGPRQIRDDCFDAGNYRLESCLETATSTGKTDPGASPSQRPPVRAPSTGIKRQ